MKITTFSALLLFMCIHVQAQNLIGFNQKEIREYMKVHCSEMSYNNVVNEKFKYLKYSDNQDNQTLLFFLDPDSVCRYMRLICDRGLKPEKIKELDAMYTKSGDNKWIEKRDGKEYLIQVMDEKWSFIVTIEQKK